MGEDEGVDSLEIVLVLGDFEVNILKDFLHVGDGVLDAGFDVFECCPARLEFGVDGDSLSPEGERGHDLSSRRK